MGPIPFDLYASDTKGGVVLFCRRDFDITERHKELLDRSSRVFYVNSDNLDLYFDYAFDRLDRIVESEKVRVHEKAQIVRGVGMRVVDKMMEDPRSSAAMEDGGRFVTTKVKLILDAPEVTNHLFALSAVEGYALSHSINVCTFCLLLGKKMYGRDSDRLQGLGIGGLIHDIGLTRVRNVLLKKAGSLTNEERAELRTHPIHSHKIASDHKFDEPVKAICRSHHEKMGGGGYPDGLKGNAIHPFARIAAVADTYDAMTSDRAYHRKMPHLEALGEMASRTESFDRDVFRALLRIVLKNEKLVDHFLKNPQKMAALG